MRIALAILFAFLVGCSGPAHFVMNEGTYVTTKMPGWTKKGSQDGGAFSYLYGPQAGVLYNKTPILESMLNVSVGSPMVDNGGGQAGGAVTGYLGWSLCLFQVICPSYGYLLDSDNSAPAVVINFNLNKVYEGLKPSDGGVAAKEIKAQEMIEQEQERSDEERNLEDRDKARELEKKYLP